MNPYESPKHYDEKPSNLDDYYYNAASIGASFLEGIFAFIIFLVLMPAWITWEALDQRWLHPCNLLGLCLCPVWWFVEITFALGIFNALDMMWAFACKLLS